MELSTTTIVGVSVITGVVGFFATHTDSPVYLIGFVAFMAWILHPLLRFRVRINHIRPGIQTYLPSEVTKYIERTKRLGKIACAAWASIAGAGTAVILGITQQGNILRGPLAVIYSVLATIFASAVIWCVSRMLWRLPTRWIEKKRRNWGELRKMGDIGGWAGWEFEDEDELGNRIAGGALDGDDRHFWEALRDRRIPIYYQDPIGGDTPIAFVLLDTRTGYRSLAIEWFENWKPLPGNALNLLREKEILDAATIHTHWLHHDDWFAGFAPAAAPPGLKGRQQRLLDILELVRDRDMKRKRPRRGWRPRLLRY